MRVNSTGVRCITGILLAIGFLTLPVFVSGAQAAAELYIEKGVLLTTDADASGDVSAADTLTYTVLLHNTGTVTLTTVTFTDTIPTGLTYVAASATITGGGSISVVGQAVSASVPSIAASTTETATFQVTIDSPLVDLDGDPTAETFTNQGTGNSDQTAALLSDGNGDPTDGEQPTSIVATATPGSGTPSPDLEKRWSLLIDGNSDGNVDVGETVLYTIRFANLGSASALGVHVTDTWPGVMTAVGGSATTTQGVVVTESPLDVNVGDVIPGDIVTIEVQVTVNAGTPSCWLTSNQATATGTNFGSAVGATDPLSDNNASDTDGISATIVAIDWTAACGAMTKSVTATSEAETAGNDVLIGEVLTFQLTAELPEGNSTTVSVVDALPTGLTYIAGTARLAHTFETDLQSASNPGGVNAAASGTFVTLTDGTDITVAGQVLTLTLGNVTNSDADANAESYVLEIQAVVANVSTSTAGTTLVNPGTLSFVNSLAQNVTLDDTQDLTVREAEFEVVESGSPGTLVRDVGGVVSYTITFTNLPATYDATAYDVVLLDQRPPQVSSFMVTSVTSSGGVSGVTDNSTSSHAEVVVDTFPVGGQVVITVEGVVNPPISGVVVKNSGKVLWTSLPGALGTADATPGVAGSLTGERDSSDGSFGPNDYLARDSFSSQVSSSVPVQTPTRTPIVSCSSRELNQCTDGVDNDCDGLLDCEDPDCMRDAHCVITPVVTVSTNTPTRTRTPAIRCDSRELNHCADGTDNDCDGAVDCNDPDCSRDQACAGTPAVDVGTGTPTPTRTPVTSCATRELNQCADGVDNDCDGLLDCDDPDCAGDAQCLSATATSAPTDMASTPTRTPIVSRTPIPTRTLIPTRTRLAGATPIPTLGTPRGLIHSVRLVAVGRVNPGAALHYSISVVVDKGLVPDIRVRHMLPREVTFVSAIPTPDVAPAVGNSGLVEFRIGDVVGPRTLRFDVVAAVRQDLSLGTKFVASTELSEGFGRRVSRSRLTRVGSSRRARPNTAASGALSAKIHTQRQVAAGTDLRYTISVRSRLDATNLIVRSTLPAGTVFLSATPSATLAPVLGNGGVVEWRVAAVKARHRLRFRINTATMPGVRSGEILKNVVEITDQEGESIRVSGTTMIR